MKNEQCELAARKRKLAEKYHRQWQAANSKEARRKLLNRIARYRRQAEAICG